MPSNVNFADPEFEPSDDELRELSREAFADVASLRAESNERLRARIAVLRGESFARLSEFLARLQTASGVSP